MRARQAHIAAEQHLALALEARAQRIGKRADARDRRDAERDAGDEDVEPAEAVALLAQCEAQHKRQAAARWSGPAVERGDRHAGASSRSMRPSAMRTTRPQRSARLTSCVTRISVAWPPPLQVEQQVDDMAAGLAVEIAGRLVGKQNLRAAGRARGPAPRAAARRPRAGPENDPSGATSRPRRASRGRHRTRRPCRQTPAEARRSPAPSWSAPDGKTGTRCRCWRRASAPARPRRAP